MSTAVQPSPPPAALRRRALLGVGIAALVVVVWALLRVSGVSDGLCVGVAALLSGLAAALASEPVERGAAMPAAAVPAVGDTNEVIRRLRHDLRGILSPALMTADRLLMTSEDPVAKRAAEAMIETVEAAERRLSI